jgi:orotidine-5'-phosphate decarboxylase
MVQHEGRSRPLWQVVALRTQEWDQKGNVGLVMGATYPQQLAEARALCPDSPILVPGVGAQEGSLRDSVLAGLRAEGDGIIISASRSILYASRAGDYALAARAAATQLKEQVNQHRPRQSKMFISEG